MAQGKTVRKRIIELEKLNMQQEYSIIVFTIILCALVAFLMIIIILRQG